MKKIALATCREFPTLMPDEKLLGDSVRILGLDAQPLVWDEPNQRLDDFAAVIVRSCWDYHFRPQAFLAWIEELENRSVRLFNPPQVLRWNHDKIYLRELEAKGIRIPPTFWLQQGSSADLFSILEQNGWEMAVVKPTISATAWQTWTVKVGDAQNMQTQFEALLATNGVMVQKFLTEIQTQGEWSFVFFAHKFSHAVFKCGRDGEFRVQKQFGGIVEAVREPPLALVVQACAILERVEENLLYARVDGIEIDGELCLMELELIEPVLFLEETPRAAQRFAEVIAEVVRR